MRSFTAIVEKDKDTDLYVGYVPGLGGAHSQGATLDEHPFRPTSIAADLCE